MHWRTSQWRVTVGAVESLHAQSLAAGTNWLSADEQARLTGLHHARRRTQFLAGRWLARTMLADWTGRPAAAWALTTAPQAAPRPISTPPDAQPPLYLSISHRGPHVGCAIGRQAIGLDIEHRRERPHVSDMARAVCAPHERQLMDATASSRERQQLFLHLWTLKEAWIKKEELDIHWTRMHEIHAWPHTQAPGANALTHTLGDAVVSLCTDAGLHEPVQGLPDAGTAWWRLLGPGGDTSGVRPTAQQPD